MSDVIVVGAGLSGCVVANRLSRAGYKVTIHEARNYIGGFCADGRQNGVTVHFHGPHCFHTNNHRTWLFLSKYADWRPYQLRVLSWVGRLVPMPVNRDTLNAILGKDMSDDEAEVYLKSLPTMNGCSNARDAAISRCGKEVYDALFAGYTKKQWGVPAEELLPIVTNRIPVRSNSDDRYFTDKYQGLPGCGYTEMCRRLIDHPNVELKLNSDWKLNGDADLVVYTGPVDRLFSYSWGELKYRGIRMQFEHYNVPFAQRVATINYPSENVAYTRITEFKHMTGEVGDNTVVGVEYPIDPQTWMEYAYPFQSIAGQEMAARYFDQAKDLKNVRLLGRLAEYKYYNMDVVVENAIEFCAKYLHGNGG